MAWEEFLDVGKVCVLGGGGGPPPPALIPTPPHPPPPPPPPLPQYTQVLKTFHKPTKDMKDVR